MRDNCGDEIVAGIAETGEVHLYCHTRDSGFRTGAPTDMLLSPKKARKLAKRLRLLADLAETSE